MKKIIVCVAVLMMVSMMAIVASAEALDMEWLADNCGYTDMMENEDGTYSITSWVGEHWKALFTFETMDATECYVQVLYNGDVIEAFDVREGNLDDYDKLDEMYLAMYMFYNGMGLLGA